MKPPNIFNKKLSKNDKFNLKPPNIFNKKLSKNDKFNFL